MKARDRALILRRYPYGESSLLVHALTPTRGRVSLLAKGAYRLHSGYFGVLDFFDTLLVTFQTRAGSDLSLVSAAEIETRRRSVSTDLHRYPTALACLELAWLGAREGEEEAGLFRLTETSLELLQAGRVSPQVVECAYELHFLRERGWSPALEACVSCGRRLASGPRSASAARSARGGTAFFSPSEGGLLCSACATEARARRASLTTLPWNALRVASTLLETPLELLPRIRLDPGIARRVLDFVRSFVEYHLETRPRSFAASAPHRPLMTQDAR